MDDAVTGYSKTPRFWEGDGVTNTKVGSDVAGGGALTADEVRRVVSVGKFADGVSRGRECEKQCNREGADECSHCG